MIHSPAKAICHCGIFLFLPACIPAAAPEYSHEFPPSRCESFSASESNSAVSVCRSQYRRHRFLLERIGFAREPETGEQTARTWTDHFFLIAGALTGTLGGSDGPGLASAHKQNPQRWEAAADEYARSRYGPGAIIRDFERWSGMTSKEFQYERFYTFEVVPGELVPPWGEWYLNRDKTGGVVLEVLDD